MGSAADLAGLMVGDEIIQVDNEDIEKFDQLQRIVRPNPGKSLEFLIRRDKKITLRSGTICSRYTD